MFRDQRDKLVRLSEPADRVVVFPNPVATTLIAVDGGTDKLVGINPAAKAVIVDSILGELFPEVSRIDTRGVGRGFIPNLEALLNVDPDVVIQWASRHEMYIEPLERTGFTVVGLDSGSYDIEGEHTTLVGKVVGKEERARSFVEWRDETRRILGEGLSEIPHEDRVRTVFFDRFRDNALVVFGRDSSFFQVTGLRNLAFEDGLNRGVVTIDAEQLLVWDPDIIFMNYYDIEASPEDVYDHPLFSSLSAVANRRVYKTPRLDPGSHEAPVAWMWMSMLAYPDLWDWDLRRSVKDAYLLLYGVSLDEDHVDNLLQMAANARGRGYLATFARAD